jgi:hypothetical protein
MSSRSLPIEAAAGGVQRGLTAILGSREIGHGAVATRHRHRDEIANWTPAPAAFAPRDGLSLQTGLSLPRKSRAHLLCCRDPGTAFLGSATLIARGACTY